MITVILVVITFTFAPIILASQRCLRNDLTEGLCVPMESCAELLRNYTNPTSGLLQTLKRDICPISDKQIHVCCDATSNVTTDIVDNANDLKNYKYCGTIYKKNTKHPWLSEIKGVHATSKFVTPLCSGILVNSVYVLSTARCIQSNRNVVWTFLTVHFGEFNFENKINCRDLLDDDDDDGADCGNFEEILVQKIIPHPFYVPETGFNDIGLLRLQSRVAFTDYIVPACLPSLDEPRHLLNDNMLNSRYKASEAKYKMVVTKLKSNRECQDLFPNRIITNYHLCNTKTGENVNETCNATSALLSFYNDSWYLEGINYDDDCTNGSLTVNLKIVKYLGWLKENMANANERCVVPDTSDEGECVPLNECPALHELFANPTARNLNYRSKFVSCRDQTEVCCQSSRKFAIDRDLTRPIANTNVDVKFDRLKLFCGMQHVQEIFNTSTELQMQEFPWLAAVRARDSRRGGEEFTYCVGSLITELYVLTAAHCLPPDEYYEIVGVRLGEYYTENVTDCVYLPRYDLYECNKFEDYGVEEKIIHPYYAFGLNDIALIRLDKRVLYSDFVRPICLPNMIPAEGLAKPGDILYATGFGLSIDNKLVLTKKKISTIMISNTNCGRIYVDNNVPASVSMLEMCSYDINTTPTSTTCAGDGGGPVMHSYKGQWYIQGITSRGTSCRENFVVTQTKVRSYINWISENLKH